MAEEITEWIKRLPNVLEPIRNLALRRLSAAYVVDPQSGALLIDHLPNVAPEAYVMVLYPGIDGSDLDRYCAIQAQNNRPIEIPDNYGFVLSYLTGADILKCRFFGAPNSMLGNPPMLDRSTRQPLDLGSANSIWRLRYKVEAQFFFGFGPYSRTENLGYFSDRDGRVETYRQGGEKVGSFPNFEELLSNVLARVESSYPE